jgi:pyrroline-5-carboxylate reductase
MVGTGTEGGATHRTLFLVGCGKMGSALLRGWIAGGVASRIHAVEPAGAPRHLAAMSGVSWQRSPEELPNEPAPDAIVFAVKPQIADTVLPG